mgnify:CR=1 FL=1
MSHLLFTTPLFISTLFYIFFFFVILVIVGGLISKYLMRRVFNRMQDNMNQHYDRQQSSKKEGKVTIEYDRDKKGKKQYKRDQGEYIDYEEVDE